MAHHFFCVAKRKKGDKGKKERVSMQKLLKGCHQGQNIIVLTILERLEFENFSCRPTIVADNTFQCCLAPPTLKSISLALYTLFYTKFICILSNLIKDETII